MLLSMNHQLNIISLFTCSAFPSVSDKSLPTNSLSHSVMNAASIYKLNLYKPNCLINHPLLLGWSATIKDLRHSGMSQSCYFWDKIRHTKSVNFRFESVIWRSESRICLRYLKITFGSSIYLRKKELLFLARAGLEPTHLWPVRSDETLSWGISRLCHCNRR